MIHQQKELGKILQESGLKKTETRARMLDFLRKNHRPLSVKDVFTHLKGIDSVTVYRNLEQFAKLGIVNKLALGRDRAYFEYAPVHHHHIVCTDCGTIEELSKCPAPKNMSIPNKTKKFAKISHHSLEFFGICKACHNSR